MILCVDVDYRPGETVTACVGIREWSDPSPCLERVVRVIEATQPYVPGEFYLREMPHLVRAVEAVPDVDLIVVDGYVWLATDRPGLGARLHEHLAARLPVVGVAKRPFHENDLAVLVRRGTSDRPLFVTAAGMDATEAAANVARMHGDHRIPTILKRVDRLARDA